ncbi:TonB-dependent receptor domain-containing protein [Kaistella sp.]|uniref:TonB-dependent receptor domain-containing protein n=1 Tax=Kaistella sp. TaxID=2782235 RepID=UPI002F9256C3
MIGGRVENNINITRYKEQGDSEFNNLSRNQYFILPSFSVKKSLNSKSNIRFAASKTITRPILIEYMPITYINPDNENIIGNKDLKNSENYNLDLKYEIFPSNKELFAVNLFAKKIDNAIERGYTASGNSNGVAITFFNAENAVLAGAEVEGIMNLSRISESLNKWSLGANATFMYSKVDRSAEQLEQEKPVNFSESLKDRKLQGAAPWAVNADLKYEYKNGQNLQCLRVKNIYSRNFGLGSHLRKTISPTGFCVQHPDYQKLESEIWSTEFTQQHLQTRTRRRRIHSFGCKNRYSYRF